MRTSGAGHETTLTYVPIAVAVICLVLFIGGPKETLREIERVATQMVLTVRDFVGSRF